MGLSSEGSSEGSPGCQIDSDDVKFQIILDYNILKVILDLRVLELVSRLMVWICLVKLLSNLGLKSAVKHKLVVNLR